MAILTIAEIRQRLANRVKGASPELRESVEPYEFFRAPGRSPIHLEYVVGIPSTKELGSNRQKTSEGTLSETDCRVLVSYQLRPKDRLTSYDEMLAVEKNIRDRLLATDEIYPKDYVVRWVSSIRSAGPADGWVYTESSFQIIHLLSLT